MFTTKEVVSSYVTLAAYSTATLLFAFPILDTIVAIVPMEVDDVTWRYAALERLSRALLPGLLGVLLAYSYALFLEQTRVMRGIAVASGIWGVVLIIGGLLFIGAATDVRAGSLARDKTAFDVAMTIGVLKYVAATLVAFAFAAPAWLAARRIRHEAHLVTPDAVAPPQLIVRPHRRETVYS